MKAVFLNMLIIVPASQIRRVLRHVFHNLPVIKCWHKYTACLFMFFGPLEFLNHSAKIFFTPRPNLVWWEYMMEGWAMYLCLEKWHRCWEHSKAVSVCLDSNPSLATYLLCNLAKLHNWSLSKQAYLWSRDCKSSSIILLLIKVLRTTLAFWSSINAFLLYYRILN